MSEAIEKEIKRMEARRCTCVSCSDCNGTGHIAVNYDGAGRVTSIGMFDDSFDLESCDSCSGGIVETCERCQEIKELEELLEEERYRLEKK